MICHYSICKKCGSKLRCHMTLALFSEYQTDGDCIEYPIVDCPYEFEQVVSTGKQANYLGVYDSNGDWYDGIWSGGVWKNGTWKGGNIWNPSKNEYVYSEVSPAEYFGKETDSQVIV